jgi:hypothetical protein
MASTLPLRRGLDEFQLCKRLDDCKGAGSGTPTALPFYDHMSALVFLRTCITSPEQERKLRRWLEGWPHPSSTQSRDEPDLLGYVAKQLVAGKLAIATLQAGGEARGIMRSHSEGSSASSRQQNRETTPLQDEMARRERAAAAQEEVIVLGEPEPEKTWIEIELIDKYGKPVPNERFKLTLPDGTVKWGRLDNIGKARVERLQPGTCQVTFPDRDEEVWDVS